MCSSFKRSAIISSIYSVFGKKEPDFIARDRLSRNLIARNRLFSEQRENECLRNMVGVARALNAKCVCACARALRQDNDRRESRRRDHWATMCVRLAYQVLVPAFVHADTHTTVRPESGPTLATKSLTDHINCNHWMRCWKEYYLIAHHRIVFRSKRA